MIVLFPTYASRLPGLRRWRANLAGMVVSPLPEKSRRRVLAVAVLRRLFDLNEEQLRQEVFRRRSAAFLFRRMPGERVQVEFAGRRIDAGRTDRVGHFNVQIDLDESVLETVAAGGGAQGSGREIAYTAWSEGLSDDGLVDDWLRRRDGLQRSLQHSMELGHLGVGQLRKRERVAALCRQ